MQGKQKTQIRQIWIASKLKYLHPIKCQKFKLFWRIGIVAFYTFLCIKFSVFTQNYYTLFKSMDAAIQFQIIGCSSVVRIQSVSSATNYHIPATMKAGINAAKLNASVGCRQYIASIGCSVIFCIQSVSSSCNYCNKAKKKSGICVLQQNASSG